MWWYHMKYLSLQTTCSTFPKLPFPNTVRKLKSVALTVSCLLPVPRDTSTCWGGGFCENKHPFNKQIILQRVKAKWSFQIWEVTLTQIKNNSLHSFKTLFKVQIFVRFCSTKSAEIALICNDDVWTSTYHKKIFWILQSIPKVKLCKKKIWILIYFKTLQYLVLH